MTRNLLVALVTAAGMLVVAPAASAFTTLPVWQCRGSAAFASVADNNRVEPIVANGNVNTANGASPDRAQCVDSETGAGNTVTQLGISPEFLGAVTGKASRLYGSSGKDHLDGGPGTDDMWAGSGNDSLNGAYGRDTALGGSGRDFINVATAGPAARVNCGTGNDVARINNNERRRVRGCERVAVFGPNDR